MMRAENEGGLSPAPSPQKDGDIATSMSDDLEASSPELKGKNPSYERITIDKLKIRLLAIAQYLQQELSTMDVEKAKHLSLLTKDKAIVMALALKALAIQYYQELKQLDKEGAQKLGAIYKEKAEKLSIKYREKTVRVAGIARRKTVEIAGKTRVKAIEVAREMKTMDRQQAKATSVDMIRQARITYGSMSPVTRIKYGIMLFVFFYVMRSSPKKGGKMIKHKNLCYINPFESDGKQKVADCENMLSGIPADITNWLFIGNEPIFDLFKPFYDHQGDYEQVKNDRKKNRKIKFYYKYDLPDVAEWTKKYTNQEKPFEIAAERGMGQGDCGRCNMAKYQHKTKNKVFENLLIESSRDVSQVTTTTSTSQETVARYIGENYQTPSQTACVIQQGMYEMKKAPWRTTKEYLQYTKEYHDLLEKHCGTLIRIGYLRENDEYTYMRENDQFNKKLQEWDEGTRDLVLFTSKNGYFIDVSKVQLPSVDGYIKPVWEMFSRVSKLLD